MSSLVLFTRDLRVSDHPALIAATHRAPVVPLFVFDRRLLGRSPNRDRFLLESLVDLDRSLVQRGGRLVTREGDPVVEAVKLAREAGCDTVHISADVSAYARAREDRLRGALAEHGITLQVHPGATVVEPGEVAPAGKDVYSVFTPFHRAWAQAPRRDVLPAPSAVIVPPGIESGRRPDPASILAESIDLAPGGETAGRKHMESYLAGNARHYADVRDDMAADATSRLSPYLRFGCLSASELVSEARAIRGADGLVRQLAWRDFYGHLLAHDPTIQWRDFREPPGDVPAPSEHAGYLFERWQMGRTGIPLVDAGMRQLRREGWMHNRARMVVGSFLTRRLGIPWQEGAVHFMRWLVDGDPANNAGGWQWVAGTGTDPRRSRAFNPVRQAERFDPQGAYVRRYVRELAGTPTSQIFAPWKDPELLRATGYPSPVLEVPSSKRPASAEASGPGVPPFRAGTPARPGQTPQLAIPDPSPKLV